MPNLNSNIEFDVGTGGGGGGLHFRVPPDTFSGATSAAAISARNTYFVAAANAGALAEFQGDQSLAIIIEVTGEDDVFQTYLPGNEGNAYAADQWVDRVDAVQSIQPGPKGDDATYSDDSPVALGDAASPGTADEAARQDHVHPNTGLATDAELAAVEAKADTAIRDADSAVNEAQTNTLNAQLEERARISGDQFDSNIVLDAQGFALELNSQANNAKGLFLVVTAPFSGTYNSVPYSLQANDILYVPPNSTNATRIMNVTPKARKINFTGDRTVAVNEFGALFRFHGNSVSTLTLPDILQFLQSEVDSFMVYNSSAVNLIIDGDGTDTINGELGYTLSPGEAITIMLVDHVGITLWGIITNTEVGESSSTSPTSGLTRDQVTDLVGTLLAGLPEFMYNAATDALTYTGITIDTVGALLAGLAEFSYDADTNTLAFKIPNGTITPQMLHLPDAGAQSQFRTAIGAPWDQETPLVNQRNHFQLPQSGPTPTKDNEYTTKKYVDDAIKAIPTSGDSSGSGGTNVPVIASLGQPNLAESDVTESGVLDVDGATAKRLEYSVVNGQKNSGEQNVRWDPDIDSHDLPDGASYDSATGILTLPEGVWIIEAVMIITVKNAPTQNAVANTLGGVTARLYEGGEFRYSEDVFFWGSIGGNPALSVTGSLVIPRGETDTVQVRMLTTIGGSTNPTLTTVIDNAHMEAIRLGDAPPVKVPDGFIAWSDDTVFTDAEFKAGQSVGSASQGEIPARSGFGYLALWLSADHWDPIREIDIDHGPNGITDLESAVDLTINGVAGQYRRYSSRLIGDVVGGEILRWR